MIFVSSVTSKLASRWAFQLNIPLQILKQKNKKPRRVFPQSAAIFSSWVCNPAVYLMFSHRSGGFTGPSYPFTGGTVACWERSAAWHLWRMSWGNKGWVLLQPVLRVCRLRSWQINNWVFPRDSRLIDTNEFYQRGLKIAPWWGTLMEKISLAH